MKKFFFFLSIAASVVLVCATAALGVEAFSGFADQTAVLLEGAAALVCLFLLGLCAAYRLWRNEKKQHSPSGRLFFPFPATGRMDFFLPICYTVPIAGGSGKEFQNKAR